MFLLNGLQFHDEPTETPLVDSTEVWNLINLTPLTHPIHLHLVQFRVLQRRAFNITSFVKGEEPQYLGEPRYRPAPPQSASWLALRLPHTPHTHTPHPHTHTQDCRISTSKGGRIR
jgi:FtsP/CotA-like multicopper oxidase with cupredoxin domain